MFDWLEDLLNDLLDMIKKVVDKIVAALGPLLPLLIISLFLFPGPWTLALGTLLPAWGVSALTIVAEWGFWTQLAVGLGVAFLITPEETLGLIDNVAELATKVGEVVAEVVTNVAGSVIDQAMSSPLTWLVLGLGAFLFLRSDSEEVVYKTAVQQGGTV